MTQPRKRFGQHFLTDPGIIHDIIDAVSPHAHDTVIEIGPGRGALTFPLLAVHPNLIAIEIDRDIITRLKRETAQYPHFQLIQADVLDFDFNAIKNNSSQFKIVGNLPYNISTPLLFHLLAFKSDITEMIFMLQKEVVDRMCAQPNTADYGRLTVMLQHDFETEFLFDVPPEAFMPPPKVNSAVIRLTPKTAKPVGNYTVFSDIVREAFQHRRKTLRHALGRFFTEHELEKAGISPQKRPGELTLAEFETLAILFTTEKKHV